jgi:hypothetical protein
MKAVYGAIARAADSLPLPVILALILALNIYWSGTLNAFGAHFEAVAGAPLLDLQNVGSILSAEDAAALVGSYSLEARSLYWSFFILDNLMPPLVFGVFALLWVYCLRRIDARWAARLLASPFLLLPFGVGLFDLAENLTFVLALAAEPETMVSTLQTGLLFVNAKAICLFATFGLTPLLIAAALVSRLRGARPAFDLRASGQAG